MAENIPVCRVLSPQSLVECEADKTEEAQVFLCNHAAEIIAVHKQTRKKQQQFILKQSSAQGMTSV